MSMLTESVRQRLKAAKRIVFFTGAGVSAESGIQTFRDADGLWAGEDPMKVATMEAFKDDPQRVWDFYVARAAAVENASPNPAHLAIAELAGLAEVTVITQNVDGLHQLAGSTRVLELHGSLFSLIPFVDEEALFAGENQPIICDVCNGYADPETIDPYAPVGIDEIKLMAGPVPSCPACGALLRPSIVWFGEALNPDVLGDAVAAIEDCDLLICVGSTLKVQPAASLPFLALQGGAVVIEVNPHPVLDGLAHATFAGAAGDVLPALIQEVWDVVS